MIRSDTESAGRYSRTEVDGSREERKSRISLSSLFKRNKDKVSGADTDTMRTVVTVDDEKVNKIILERSFSRGAITFVSIKYIHLGQSSIVS